MLQIIDSAWVWGVAGSLLFSGALFVHHYFGPGPDVRDEHGKRKKIAPEYRTFVAVEMILIIAILLACATLAIVGYRSSVPDSTMIQQALAAYVVLFIINLWDLVVIDWALVVRFRPKGLDLPDTPYFNTVKPHFLGWLAGNIYMLPFAGIAYLISTAF